MNGPINIGIYPLKFRKVDDIRTKQELLIRKNPILDLLKPVRLEFIVQPL